MLSLYSLFYLRNAETINILKIIGKFYLNNSKTIEKPIFVFYFLTIIRDNLESMIGGAAIVGCDAVHWQGAILVVLWLLSTKGDLV